MAEGKKRVALVLLAVVFTNSPTNRVKSSELALVLTFGLLDEQPDREIE